MDFVVMSLAAADGLLGMLSAAWFILLVALGFTAVIFVHELGHFLAAKKVGIRVERFAIGFGPRLFGIRRGGTDYCINLLPLGGYVKMAGQEDFRLERAASDDPRAYSSKSVGQRMAVVSAGVIMNVVFAVVLFMVVFLHGKRLSPNQVGSVAFNSPAYGRISPGDSILEVDGTRTRDFMDIALNVALHGGSQPLSILVRRGETGREEEVRLSPVRARELEGLPSIGVEGEAMLRVGPFRPEYVPFLAEAGVQAGDRLVEAAGRAVTFYSDLVRLVDQTHGAELPAVFVGQRDGREVRIPATLKPKLPLVTDRRYDRLNVLGAHPRLKIIDFRPGTPADGKFKPDDIVLAFGGEEHPNYQQWVLACQAAQGRPVDVRILRDGTEQDVEVVPHKAWGDDQATVGVLLGLEEDRAVVGRVDSGSELARAGIGPGSEILAVLAEPADQAGAASTRPEATTRPAASQPASRPDPLTWGEFYRALLGSAGSTVAVRHLTGGEVRSARLAVPPAEQWKDQFIFYPPGMPLEAYKVLYKAEGNWLLAPLRAAWMGVEKTWRFIQQAYLTLLRLASGRFGLRHATGPLGIAVVSYRSAEQGIIELLFFLGLISANLAVVNFLPLPITDGGLFMFLIVEKIKRRPLSLRVQHISQVIGIVLVVSIFLLVTWQDIVRFIIRRM